MKKHLLFFVFTTSAFLSPSILFADTTPIASNLQASLSSINSGQPVGFSWSLSQSGGSFFLVPCQSGIKISYADGSGSVACDTQVSLSNTNNDAASLLINNISGSVKTVTFKVIPKNTSGSAYDAGTIQTQVTVYPLQEPIESASLSPFSPTSGSVATLSWIGKIIDGVNISIDCSSYITASSTSYNGKMPCGTPIFSSDLGVTGSIPISFTNNDSSSRSTTIKIFPAISPGVYDGTHAKIITADIQPYVAPIASISGFSASSTTILSGADIKVSWGATNVLGMNIRLSCDGSTITATSSASPATILSCAQNYISESLLPTTGTITFNFKNKGTESQSVTVSLVPSLSSGTYDGTKAQNISFIVLKNGDSLPYNYTVTSPTQTNSSSPQNTGGTMKKARLTFTRALKVGFRGDDVKALQEFFAQDSSIYPEGLTTGYFGPATLKAIQRFQAKYGIASSGTPETTGYGALGPKTRGYINQLK